MHKFNWGPIEKEYPENWNELNKEQLLFVATLMRSGVERKAFDTLLLQKLLNIPWFTFNNIPIHAMEDMAKSISFIHEKFELTKNLLPEISVKKGKEKVILYGPTDGMTDCTLEQFFAYAETYFTLFAQTNEEENLNLLCACLYRFEKNSIFNPEKVDEISLIIKEMKAEFKQAILLYYLGCRDFFAYKFPELFSGEQTYAEKSDLHFFTLIDNLNNEDITKNNQIKQSNLYEAFVRLVQMIKKSDNSRT